MIKKRGGLLMIPNMEVSKVAWVKLRGSLGLKVQVIGLSFRDKLLFYGYGCVVCDEIQSTGRSRYGYLVGI